jgi:hypothetical protein
MLWRWGMICLRCGYCCIKYSVAIVKNPELELSESNIQFKLSDKRCPHLIGDKSGELSCKLHGYDFYKDTPCFNHTQTEFKNSNCRLGEYILKDSKILEKFLIKSI